MKKCQFLLNLHFNFIYLYKKVIYLIINYLYAEIYYDYHVQFISFLPHIMMTNFHQIHHHYFTLIYFIIFLIPK
jgi:hypothetical protein